jgi:hypothetical protein
VAKFLRLVLLLAVSRASAEEPAWIDARVTAAMQLFDQGLVPGLPGVVTRVEPAFPITLLAFSRFGGVPVPHSSGTLSGELSAWGRAGPLDGTDADGDLTAAWVQYASNRWHLRLGRQITLPGSSRYVRFDGASGGVSLGPADVDAYAGWVALPRWSSPRGAYLAGFATDALLVPSLVESQNRAGQLTWGARVAFRLGTLGRAGVAYHEQRDAIGLAYRVVGADALLRPSSWIDVGGRITFDTVAASVAEARLWVDVRTSAAPVSFDYSFQSPALLLPKSSVLAAFGGLSWHELGAESTLTLLQSVKVTARGAGQLFEGSQAGGRGSLKLTWTPGIDGRGLLLAELGRALVPPSGFTFARVGARWRATERLWTSADAAAYRYDAPIRGQSYSLTGIASVEWMPVRWMRGLLSTTVMTTPYSSFEVQALARASFELGTVEEGATP